MREIADKITVQPGGGITGRIRVPGDKSISHRAVMFASLADGRSEISGCLLGEDVRSTMAAFRAMGVSIDESVSGQLAIDGVGIDGLRTPGDALDMGNSGTSMRLLCGILAGSGIGAELIGDASLSKRPMQRVIAPLQQMGAEIGSESGKPPLRIVPGHPLHPIDYEMPVASAQVKSAVLLAGLFADGRTSVTEPAVTRDHTERMLGAFGVTLETVGPTRFIDGGQRLKCTNVRVPADISSAAFFMVGAALSPGADLTIENVGVNPTRTGIIDILRLMGADITLSNPRSVGDEPIADITIRGGELHGADIPEHLVPLAIDEFPVIFVAAAAARGHTKISGAAELRVKESDRIAVMADGLQKLGVDAVATADGMTITGQAQFGGGTIDSRGDHRIAMAFAVAGVRITEPLLLTGCGAIATSFPNFAELSEQCGLHLLASDNS
ncbi:MAG: 3-phosphoshikimate 1-carboxyvinyltransferase [Gammaproteobacteria bacterium]